MLRKFRVLAMSESSKRLSFEDCWLPKKPRPVRPKRGGSSSRRPARDRRSSGGDVLLPPQVAGAISEADKATLARVVRGAPEVVVKVTKPVKVGKDGEEIAVNQRTESVRVSSHMSYISRNGKIDLETSDGHVLSDQAAIGQLTSEWLLKHDEARDNGDAGARTRITTGLVFSMPAEVNAEAVKDAVRCLAENEFGGRHDYVMALHTDTAHPHVHLTVRTVGYDGVKLNLRKADLQHLRDQFARRLRQRGIEAEATPRHARGVTRKAPKMAVYKVRQQGKAVRSDQAKRAEVEKALQAHGGRLPDYPWEHALLDHRNRVIGTYIKAAAALSVSDHPEDQKLARDTERYVAGLTGLMTERAQVASEVRQSRVPGVVGSQKKEPAVGDRERGLDSKQHIHSQKGQRDRKR